MIGCKASDIARAILELKRGKIDFLHFFVREADVHISGTVSCPGLFERGKGDLEDGGLPASLLLRSFPHARHVPALDHRRRDYRDRSLGGKVNQLVFNSLFRGCYKRSATWRSLYPESWGSQYMSVVPSVLVHDLLSDRLVQLVLVIARRYTRAMAQWVAIAE